MYRTSSTSEITEDNTVKTTGNGSTDIGEVIMPRIRNGSGIDFMTKIQKKLGQNIVRFGARDQESVKLETSLVPNTLWNTDGQELRS